MMPRPKGINLTATPEQVVRVRALHGTRVSDDHLLWLRARGRRAPNNMIYSYPLLGEIEGLSTTLITDIVKRRNAYDNPDPTVGYFERLKRWVDRGSFVPPVVEQAGAE